MTKIDTKTKKSFQPWTVESTSAKNNPLEDLRKIARSMQSDIELLDIKKQFSIDYARELFNDEDYYGASVELSEIAAIENLERDCKKLKDILKHNNELDVS